MLAERLAAPLRQKGNERDSIVSDSELSERERDVIKMIAQGYSGKQIADHLNVSRKSIDTYKMRAMEKLGLDSRTEIVRHAFGQGWLEDI